ncbi:hypothetical protein QFC19_008836 [Naganishia cerealis]|uniref:Uncharacterized protein n=1 Tax=Naganishia cerealis TaxID=610337 RepID=A0ACC2UYK7_9TREE|nr:hypothetical protein QFC19_008836 [Naganishia cerealis]
MSTTTSVHITIRPAKDDEYAELGDLHAAAFLTDPLWQRLVADVDPAVWLLWYFGQQARIDVESGLASIIVARRTDTDAIVGMAWLKRFTQEHPPTRLSYQFPEGWNTQEHHQMDVPRLKFQQELFAKYGKFMYIHEVAVAVDHQAKGIGKQIIQYVMEEAKQGGLNVALTAAPGKAGFYEKLGFKARGKPIMTTDGMLKGITLMDLELFETPRHLRGN